MREEQGNILYYVGKVDVIAHQVNVNGVMGGGLALQIKEAYPEVYGFYKSRCDAFHRDGLKVLLGSCMAFNFRQSKTLCANLFGQELSGSKRETNYEAIYNALDDLRDLMVKVGLKSVAFPYGMSCGLGGGDWRIVSAMIEVVFEGSGIDIVIVKYDPQ